jgi:nucleoside-diphosphate-sugar epimerase
MIAVTGANGLLGSFIIRELMKQKLPFVALKRKDSDLSLLHDVYADIQWMEGDVLDPVALDEALKNISHVIHTAAMVSFNPRARRKIFDVNVQGTRHVVNACLANDVKKIVHISSVAALGRLKGQDYIDETQKWTDNPLNSTYAESKYLAELEVIRGQEEGLETVILNPSVILAGADWTKSSAKLFKYVWDEKRFYIASHLNYVDVRDVARASVELLQRSHPGERFILNGGSIPLSDFFAGLAVRFSKKAPSVKLNKTLLQTVAFLEGMRSRLAGAEPLITPETARLAGTRFHYHNEKIKKHLNFQFQTIDHTLDWCCEYYINRFGPKK